MYDEIFSQMTNCNCEIFQFITKNNAFFFLSEKLTVDQNSQQGEGKPLFPD